MTSRYLSLMRNRAKLTRARACFVVWRRAVNGRASTTWDAVEPEPLTRESILAMIEEMRLAGLRREAEARRLWQYEVRRRYQGRDWPNPLPVGLPIP